MHQNFQHECDVLMEFSSSDVGVKVGLEIHQQLATNKKLFCDCAPIESDQYPIKFQRRLRASKSEFGEFDPAALFEDTKAKTIMYYANPQSSCLVEQDEEPPHRLDPDAKYIALVVCGILKANVFDEIYPMRKTVIDGSNTTGFQRTMLVSQGGFFKAGNDIIKVQSICLEEDAAKILGDKDQMKQYGLERLGVPLVEIATEPFETEPKKVRDIALALGRILRSTKKVKRGLGSIRQDVNVSIKDGGVVIEVKGVQQLDQLENVIKYEAKRQHGLLRISAELKKRDWTHDKVRDRLDITEPFTQCRSKIIQNAIAKNHRIFAISFRNMAGMFGFLPYENIRLGREVAELVRFFGIGGVFHSDELPNYGIETAELENLRHRLDISEKDAFLILAAPASKMHKIIDQIILRVSHIRNCGIPTDTRLATQQGETKFLRPRPGAARMYPETDVPPIIVSKEELKNIQENLPKSWDESIQELETKYDLNAQLAEQIFDSEYMESFEQICSDTENSPNYVASVLCSTVTSLERRGGERKFLTGKIIADVFGLLDDGKISKESIEIVLEEIMAGKNPDEIVKNIMSASLSDEQLDVIIEKLVNENKSVIIKQKQRAAGPLMGIAMKTLRGKTSGQKINKKLQEKIQKLL